MILEANTKQQLKKKLRYHLAKSRFEMENAIAAKRIAPEKDHPLSKQGDRHFRRSELHTKAVNAARKLLTKVQ